MKVIIKKLYWKYLSTFHSKKIVVESLDVSTSASLGGMVRIGKQTELDGKCSVGAYSYIGKNCTVTNSTIGAYCSIANNVSIGQGEHSLDKISTNSIFYESSYDELTKEPCNIGNDVWIGVDTIILRGVYVGDGAVVGANSVVTRDVPDFAVVVGSPARVIKYRFTKEKSKRIKNSKWWLCSPTQAQKIFKEVQ